MILKDSDIKVMNVIQRIHMFFKFKLRGKNKTTKPPNLAEIYVAETHITDMRVEIDSTKIPDLSMGIELMELPYDIITTEIETSDLSVRGTSKLFCKSEIDYKNVYESSNCAVDFLNSRNSLNHDEIQIFDEITNVCICMIDIVGYSAWCSNHIPQMIACAMINYNTMICNVISKYSSLKKSESSKLI